MDTPESLPASQPSRASLPRDLIQRRVPHILAIYAGASWGLVEFTAFAVDEFLISPHWTRMVMVTLLIALPSVFLLAWFHGKPGRERDQLARAEKVGIPANLVLCVVVLTALFGGEGLGSVMTTVAVETEDGETIEREVPTPEFTKTMALFPLDLGPGMAEDDAWVSYAVPEALRLDLLADEFFVPISFYRSEWHLRERGFERFDATPLTLKREMAQESFAGFMAVGEIDRVDDLFRVTLSVYRAGNGSLAGESFHEGTDLLALVDEMSGPVKNALEIPVRDAVEDLPVRGRLSDNTAAVEAFFKGFFRYRVHQDAEGATEYLTTATTLDPSFTIAQYTLHLVLRGSTADEAVAAAPLVAAMEHLYRVPERSSFQIKAEYYAETGETDRVAAVVEMWVGLYPNDLIALRALAWIQMENDDWEGALATLATIRRLDPLDGRPISAMARIYENVGNYDQSLALLAEYVERFPGDLSGHYGLADYHQRRGRYESAREVLEQVIALEPLAAESVRRLADLDLDVGRMEEARAGYERTLRQARTPAQRAQALARLTHYHHRRGEIAAAIQGIERRREESAFETPLDMAIGDALVYLDAGRTDKAIALLQEFDDLRLVLDQAGDYEGAAESLRAVIALSPEGRYFRGAGSALRRAGSYESEGELQEALRLAPANPRAHLEMALLMETRGEVGVAVEHLQRALAVWENADEDYESARLARAKLAELGR